MKQFNLEEYLKNPSKKIVTRDGRNVTIHCTDYIDKGSGSVIAKIEGNMYSYSFREDGSYVDHKETNNDLFFAPEKHEGWINIKKTALGYYCSSHIFQTKEDAESHEIGGNCLVATKKVEWEE